MISTHLAPPFQYYAPNPVAPPIPTLDEKYKPFPHYNLEVVQWSLIFGVCLILGVGMGANDIADSFGTSVGTGILTVTQAFILATVVEMMGSVASGFSGDGQQLQVVNTESYEDNPDELVIGQIAMLVGCATWLMVATFYSMPVSAIHSLLGATIGFSLVLRGLDGIVWDRVGMVMAVWILSPIVSAIFTLITFFLVDVAILRAKNPVKRGIFLLPGIYAIVVFSNVFLFLQDGSKVFRIDEIPFLYTVAASLIIAVLAGFLALFVVGPIMQRKLKKKTEKLPRIASSLSYTFPIVPRGWLRRAVYWAFPPMRNDDQKAVRLFSFLQILTACFAGFAHGANDISNCVGPVRDLVHMYNEGYREDNTKLNITVYILLLTTLAVVMGIWTLGVRVIRTVGKFSKMNPATGFSVQFGAAITALVNNMYNIPESGTHCLVGSIFGLGLVRSGPILEWHTVKYVFVSWILTIPGSGLISAAVMYLLQAVLG
ncbi:Phosphate transporter [Caenorhabditis elegans]|uniref:Phosphate transporter n=1 Tax=Caenorhabditis elegans TaxID=6239 RepID=P91840_CAEEL|nr:Phosphate transporter [Caenorhabditis elegans]CAB03482.2 Phosphate transporter [Caenorhabditis elegans]|eukprot:NP_496646.2 Phosphate transporter [Caenorhabditis elegans]